MLWWILVGLIAGWATGKLARSTEYEMLTDVVLGVAGALLGGLVMRAIGFVGRGSLPYTIFVAIFGAVLLTWVGRMWLGRRGTPTR